jgi:pimeloyl-ACP methyl ester carboxylesterase
MKWNDRVVNFFRKWLGIERPLVVLIAGVGGFDKGFLRLGKAIEGWGFRVIYPGSIDYSMDKIVEIAEEIRELIVKEKPKSLYLIGHSKGGLTARYLVHRYEEIEAITKKVITIASPHGGTVWGILPIEGLREMEAGCDFLKEIEGKNLDKIVNFYPKLDEKVIPNESLVVKGAENQVIEVVGHARILKSPVLMERLKTILK